MTPRKKAIIESHIPHVPEALTRHFEIVRLTPDEITPESVSDADALIVRTRTRCDKELLEQSKVQFIATATIGTDHLDLDWLRSRGIATVSAPGCNAPAVAQYIFASLLRHPQLGGEVEGKSIAVAGVGHVGTIVARWAEALGMNVRLVDPPRQRSAGDLPFVTLDEAVMDADVVTFHTPLTRSGADATYHIGDKRLIDMLKPGAIVANAARGGIVDEAELLKAVESGRLSAPIIDCWESEPRINPRLLESAFVATPHIAGYSAEGKLRATRTVIDALCRHFGTPTLQFPELSDVTGAGADSPTPTEIVTSYNPLTDTMRLRNNPSQFESLRNNYNYRHEVG